MFPQQGFAHKQSLCDATLVCPASGILKQLKCNIPVVTKLLSSSLSIILALPILYAASIGIVNIAGLPKVTVPCNRRYGQKIPCNKYKTNKLHITNKITATIFFI
ncbi:MAG: hypothetical protein LBJ00_14350 [Planctomycetaceae bacterium]|nr:hypothetical protein [Planctomycetaceae bacterium]